MKITHIRNATLLLEFQSEGHDIGLLIDPMLAPQATPPSLKYFGVQRRRNPLVGLPGNTAELLSRTSHCLITHCQRGHFDHLDGAGKQFLRNSGIPAICMPRDDAYLSARGIVSRPLSGNQTQPFFHGHITPIPCTHGRGFIGSLMEHGHGYFIDLPGEPSVYIAGDTLLTEPVRRCLIQRQPQVSILPGGGARFDLGAKILMDGEDVLEASLLTSGIIVVNHLQALDHCPTTRAKLNAAAASAGVMERLHVPADGESLDFQR